jgi:hypothetical protein
MNASHLPIKSFLFCAEIEIEVKAKTETIKIRDFTAFRNNQRSINFPRHSLGPVTCLTI